MGEKAHEMYICLQHATVIATGFFQRLGSRLLLPKSSHFLTHSSLRGGNSTHQLRELHWKLKLYGKFINAMCVNSSLNLIICCAQIFGDFNFRC